MFLARISIVVGACLIVSACAAASWQVPDAVARARAGMNAASAEATLRKALVKSASANGLCGRVTAGPSYPRFMDLNQGELTFSDRALRVSGAKVTGRGAMASVRTQTTEETVQFSFNFKAVERVFIMKAVERGQCSAAAGNLPVNLKDAEGMTISVDLAPASYDSFLAAVLFTSPNARVTEGAGL